jgi:hypothetical protein
MDDGSRIRSWPKGLIVVALPITCQTSPVQTMQPTISDWPLRERWQGIGQIEENPIGGVISINIQQHPFVVAELLFHHGNCARHDRCTIGPSTMSMG